MELRHLRYFLAVAEEGHITRAAERLGLQQPPLSQQIQALERELDVQLFRRMPRGVELTEAGRAYLAEVRAAMAQLDQARLAAQRTARGEAGRIAIGFTGSASFHPFVPRAIRAFRDSHKQISVALEESSTTELVAALRQGQIDAAFVRSAVGDAAGLEIMPLPEEEMLAAVPTGHKLAPAKDKDPALPLAALSGETFILYRRPTGAGLYDTIIAACHRAGFTPQIGQEAPRMMSTLSLVAAGLGVTIVPASLRRLQLEGVAYRRLNDPRLRATLSLACRQNDESASVRRFAELVRRLAKSRAAER
jgi:DNA-binding transcriptional LysR family regulator